MANGTNKKVLLVVFEPIGAGATQPLAMHEALKRSGKWWHYLQSTWIVVTTETPNALASRVHSSMTKGDKLLVVEMTNNYNGWLPKDAWDWIQRELPLKPN
jgi:hypothetical protein